MVVDATAIATPGVTLRAVAVPDVLAVAATVVLAGKSLAAVLMAAVCFNTTSTFGASTDALALSFSAVTCGVGSVQCSRNSNGCEGGTKGCDGGTEGCNGGTEGCDGGTEGCDCGTEGCNGGTEGCEGGTEGCGGGTEGCDDIWEVVCLAVAVPETAVCVGIEKADSVDDK